MMSATSYSDQTHAMLGDFFGKVALEPGDLVVLGLSTSEVAGACIGAAPAPKAGEEIVREVLEALRARNIDLAVQCCEHLNRALVIEKKAARARGLEIVSVAPYPDAGGSAATAAYALMDGPVVVECAHAQAGIDIGVTMIGMHIAAVAVPVRTGCIIGAARVDFAYARPKLIGGERAKYR